MCLPPIVLIVDVRKLRWFLQCYVLPFEASEGWRREFQALDPTVAEGDRCRTGFTIHRGLKGFTRRKDHALGQLHPNLPLEDFVQDLDTL